MLEGLRLPLCLRLRHRPRDYSQRRRPWRTTASPEDVRRRSRSLHRTRSHCRSPRSLRLKPLERSMLKRTVKKSFFTEFRLLFNVPRCLATSKVVMLIFLRMAFITSSRALIFDHVFSHHGPFFSPPGSPVAPAHHHNTQNHDRSPSTTTCIHAYMHTHTYIAPDLPECTHTTYKTMTLFHPTTMCVCVYVCIYIYIKAISSKASLSLRH